MRPILIVEDEPAIADLIEMTLEPLGQPLIKAHTGRRAATLQAFDAVIDPDNHIVTQNGTRVELTPREFDLLLALVRARGQLLYREALYERVWGLDSNAGPRTVDIHIHRLRKKLHWDHKIVTVPKVGYKLLP